MVTQVKIDFIVPGISKCGTTTLAALLSEHPGIFIPGVKEPWYFSSDDYENIHGSYDNIYVPAKHHQLKGDCSTSYSSFRKEKICAQRIYENNPDCKVIFIVRHPKARMISSYKEMHHSAANFGLLAPYKLGRCLEEFPQIVQDSLYLERLQTYEKTFGKEQMLVIFMEDMIKDRQSVLDKCFEHLGLASSDFPNLDQLKLNDGGQKRYDSRLLRVLRKNKLTRKKTSELAHGKPDTINKLGLRPTFGKKKIKWDAQALSILETEVYPDTRNFLKYYDKPASFWDLSI